MKNSHIYSKTYLHVTLQKNIKMFTYTVKPVFNGHSNKKTPYDEGTLSQIIVSSHIEKLKMNGHLLLDIEVSSKDRI